MTTVAVRDAGAAKPSAAEAGASKPSGEMAVIEYNFTMPAQKVLNEVYAPLVGRTPIMAASGPEAIARDALINLKTASPITKSEAIKALETALAMNGIMIVPVDDKLFRVVPKIPTAGGASAVNSAAAPAFGPVVERVVADSKAPFQSDAERAKALMMIDFDTGSLLAGPAAVWAQNTDVQKSWMQTNGVDALGAILQANGLVCLDMKVAAVPASVWDETSALAVSSQLAGVKAQETVVLSGQEGLLSTWLFQTREGGKGILQITGLSDNPYGVKIRYKLVQNGGGRN